MTTDIRPPGTWRPDWDFLGWILMMMVLFVVILTIPDWNFGAWFLWVLIAVFGVYFAAAAIYSMARGRYVEVARAVEIAAGSDADQVVTIGDDDGLLAVTAALASPSSRVLHLTPDVVNSFWSGRRREVDPTTRLAAVQANLETAGVADRVGVQAQNPTELNLADASVPAVIGYRMLGGSTPRKQRDAMLAELLRITEPGGHLALIINQNSSFTGGWGWRRAVEHAGFTNATISAEGFNRSAGLKVISATR